MQPSRKHRPTLRSITYDSAGVLPFAPEYSGSHWSRPEWMERFAAMPRASVHRLLAQDRLGAGIDSQRGDGSAIGTLIVVGVLALLVIMALGGGSS